MRSFQQLLADQVSPRVFHLEDWPENELAVLKELYDMQPIFIERLPYTAMFDAIVREMDARLGGHWDNHTVYNLLLVLRKNGRLLPKR